MVNKLETESGKDIATAGKVEDVTACSVTVNVEDVAAADSVKDIVLFEKMSKEPLPLEPAGNVKQLVALFKSALLISFNPSRITCFLLSTRASDVPQSPRSVRGCSPLSNWASVLLSADIEGGGGESSPLYSRSSNNLARKRLAYANTEAVLRVTMASSGKEEILLSFILLTTYIGDSITHIDNLASHVMSISLGPVPTTLRLKN